MTVTDPREAVARQYARESRRRMTARQTEKYELGRKVWEARLAGFSFDDITVQLNKARQGKPLPPTQVYTACQFYMERVDRSTMADMKWLVIDRLDKIYQSLTRKAQGPGVRAEEIQIKALERLCALMGLDYEHQKDAPSTQPITINITAHPGDPEAQRLIRDVTDRGREVDRELPALPPSAQGALQPEADRGAVWWDGGGQVSGSLIPPPIGHGAEKESE